MSIADQKWSHRLKILVGSSCKVAAFASELGSFDMESLLAG